MTENHFRVLERSGSRRNPDVYLFFIMGLFLFAALGMASNAAYKEEQINIAARPAEHVQRLAARQQASDEAAALFLQAELTDKRAVLQHTKDRIDKQELDLRELYQARAK